MLGRRKGREMQLWPMSHRLRDPGTFHFSTKVQSLSPVWNTAVNLKGRQLFCDDSGAQCERTPRMLTFGELLHQHWMAYLQNFCYKRKTSPFPQVASVALDEFLRQGAESNF